MADNKVKYGLRNAKYAILSEDTGKYGEWKSIGLAVKLTADPQSNENKKYADDKVVFVTSSATSETGTIEVTEMGDQALMDLIGYAKDETSGLTYLATDAKRPTVALAYEIQGDAKARRTVRYGVTFSIPSDEANTMGDSVDPDDVTLSYTAIGHDFQIDGATVNVLKATIAKGDEGYDNFFTKVLVPGSTNA